ncbi:MAG: hypothetical protein IKG27_05075 [Bacilli bacterium]|nr:hypothetical protein [Bacilli bacterium]
MNIDRRSFLLLTGSLAMLISGCNNKIEEQTTTNQMYGVCYNGKVAVIVPEEAFNIDIYYEDYHHEIPAFDGNFAIFPSYDAAGEFAYEITGGNGNIYEYEVNEQTGEFDITGVCFNGDSAVIVPEDYLDIDIYYEDYHYEIPAFSGNIALFPNHEQAEIFAGEIVGVNGNVYDYSGPQDETNRVLRK